MNFEKHFPKVRLSNKGSKDKPWITRALKVSSQHKNNLYKKWINSKSPNDESNYRKYKQIYSKLIRQREAMLC